MVERGLCSTPQGLRGIQLREDEKTTVELNLTKDEAMHIQSLLSWTKVALRYDDNEKKIIEKGLHKIRKAVD